MESQRNNTVMCIKSQASCVKGQTYQSGDTWKCQCGDPIMDLVEILGQDSGLTTGFMSCNPPNTEGWFEARNFIPLIPPEGQRDETDFDLPYGEDGLGTSKEAPNVRTPRIPEPVGRNIL